MQTSVSVKAAGPRRAPGFAALAAAALLLGACEREDAANAQPAPPPPPQVGFTVLQPQTVALTAELPGRTVAYRSAEVRPQVDGIIQQRLFEEGATVEAGQPLYQIDPAVYQAAVKAAEAALARAQASFESSSTRVRRYRELVGRNAVSQQDYDDMLATQAEDAADVASAEAQLERARIDLEYTVVSAPISGRIGRSAITEGALVTANQADALARITQLDPIYVDLTQSSGELMRTRRAIEAGAISVSAEGEAPVELILEEGGGTYAHEGRVQFSEVLVNETTGTVSLRAVFPNPERELLPGLFVRAVISQGEARDAFLVPQPALARGGDGQAYVWVIGEDDTVTQRPVTVRRAVGGAWLIGEGLAAGERLVVDGLQRVQPDSKVTPVAVEPASAGAGPAQAAGEPGASG
ncbi:MAG: efflux RND transporter periplasmic adaptor subunit [Tistlia sp.]|uniref:efflux RND transporter periplasmic adaptor subunit n=1 Tax=Tistlia sp. TaxID=3057121 RepID=UPI0034A47C99